MTSKTFNKDGTLASEEPGTRPHPMGSGPRDVLGRPLAGPHAGTWEPGSPDSPLTPGSRMHRAADAIRSLDRSVPENFTAKGRPLVEAVERAANVQITWTERDALVEWIASQAALAGDGVDTTTSRRKR